MKLTGIIQHLDKKGRIGIPTGLKYVIGIQEDTVPIEFYLVDEMLILQRYRGACAITGKISRHNISLANGKIKLHPKEVGQLIKELKEYLGKKD
ncbi:AbrB family transcriptional regulator [[Bacillus thuringiensis] serovar konkukian]|uniref:AbrB family transcriptional regulator n=1 Tax=Bacillus thuringiensis TaxID=1428 RepID=UPI0007F1006D|nr:AbrB family transcriptional regulator [Bacillus thuringiensis]ANN35470.1 AbrB family transcriptional regulator [Bacillus thuringiensis serovar coreanensis]MED1305528.1 AbrB family transcriptional regulator [Bacillus pacificus]OUB20078.1 AbrB family transcriptional regulator [[Bacillus thuringiensis] serovar konkukian]